MQNDIPDLIKDIVLILIFLAGTLWMWNIVKLPPTTQYKMEMLFKRSRYRFKWLFLIGFLMLTGLFIWQQILKR